MLLTITTTYRPATDLGFLLHKNPDSVQQFELSFGKAHVFYPEATVERCTAALLVEVDPVQLARGKGPQSFDLQPYVNDRPYVASSFLSVAIAQVFGTALGGRSTSRPELAETAIPLVATLPALPARGGADLLYRLFSPLGYAIQATPLPLDARFPEWGESAYVAVELRGTVRLQDLLSHLYVLIPVLDDDKHYWVGQDEVEKLLRHAGPWLANHPARELIANRYLARQRPLTRAALSSLEEPAAEHEEDMETEAPAAEQISLNQQRHGAVLAALRAENARSVLDVGCGEGLLLRSLLADPQFERIAGMDVSPRALERAADRLHLDRLPPGQRRRLTLFQGSLLYRDERLAGYDAAALVEVIEHLDEDRLAAFERVLFECASPSTVILTTPNAEYNAVWESLPAGTFRHRDHRFEWNRARFRAWAEGVGERFGYRVRFLPVGPEHPEFGPPTQMGVFSHV